MLSTGNELVDFQDSTAGHPDAEEWGGIYDTNRPALLTALREAGYPAIDLGIIKDERVFACLHGTFWLNFFQCAIPYRNAEERFNRG